MARAFKRSQSSQELPKTALISSFDDAWLRVSICNCASARNAFSRPNDSGNRRSTPAARTAAAPPRWRPAARARRAALPASAARRALACGSQLYRLVTCQLPRAPRFRRRLLCRYVARARRRRGRAVAGRRTGASRARRARRRRRHQRRARHRRRHRCGAAVLRRARAVPHHALTCSAPALRARVYTDAEAAHASARAARAAQPARLRELRVHARTMHALAGGPLVARRAHAAISCRGAA
jgi:hypothetical protein